MDTSVISQWLRYGRNKLDYNNQRKRRGCRPAVGYSMPLKFNASLAKFRTSLARTQPRDNDATHPPTSSPLRLEAHIFRRIMVLG
jgi:hypothetical protein